MRRGIFMGSFDPPHIGHVTVVAEALRQKVVDSVHVVPAWKNVWKDTKTSFDERCKMCSLAFSNISGTVYINSIEKSLIEYNSCYVNGVPSYVTMRELHRLNELLHNDVYFITTEETYNEIPLWEKGQEIMESYKFLVCGRDIQIPKLAISSTMIRQLLIESKNVIPYITQDVQRYINEQNLYK